MSENKLKVLGWIGTALSVSMYVSYIPQIMDNLNGNKTVLYALLKDKRDYPLAAANAPGVIFGLIAAITAL